MPKKVLKKWSKFECFFTSNLSLFSRSFRGPFSTPIPTHPVLGGPQGPQINSNFCPKREISVFVHRIVLEKPLFIENTCLDQVKSEKSAVSTTFLAVLLDEPSTILVFVPKRPFGRSAGPQNMRFRPRIYRFSTPKKWSQNHQNLGPNFAVFSSLF